MPMHDWTKAEPGTFHSFHLLWIAALATELNRILPKGFYALGEKFMGSGEADVLALSYDPPNRDGGTVLLTAPPAAKLMEVADEEAHLAYKANRVVVRFRDKTVVAAVEIVSPGNKSNKRAFRKFLSKSVGLINRGVHLLVVDPFPPGRRDPDGIHCAIWDHFNPTSAFQYAPDKNRILASYDADAVPRAFVETLGVGDELKEMPLFLLPGQYINVPLEKTYMQTWDVFPEAVRIEVE